MRVRERKPSLGANRDLVVGRREAKPVRALPRIFRQVQQSGNQSVLSLMASLGRGEHRQTGSALAPASGLSPELTISHPNDRDEREAGQLAEQALRSPVSPTHSRCSACEQHGAEHKCPKCQGREREVRRKESGAGPQVAPAIVLDVLRSPGQPLDAATRAFFEPRFGHDFGSVRVHSDARAAESARAVNASAFALGRDVAFGAGQYSPETEPGRRLLAHELAHVAQYDASPRSVLPLRRKLLATGSATDIRDFLDMLRPAAGVSLRYDPTTHEVTIGLLEWDAPKSGALFKLLYRLISSTVDTKIHVGRHQPGAVPAAFPDQQTGTGEQILDVDDFLKLEADAPGSGVAIAAHELEENFQAQQKTGPWKQRFTPSHEAAKLEETAVAEQLVGPGKRTGSQSTIPKKLTPDTLSFTQFIEYTDYYLGYDVIQNTPTKDLTIQQACRLDKVVVGTHTLSGFPPGGSTLPKGIGTTYFHTAVLMDMNKTDAPTVQIEGFAAPGENSPDDLSRARAQAFFDSVLTFPGGETATVFGRGVVPQVTPGHPEKDRKIVVTVLRPAFSTCAAAAQPAAPAAKGATKSNPPTAPTEVDPKKE